MPRVAYKNKDGKRVPGVTTIAGAFKGDITGLLVWSNRGGLEGKTLDDLYGASTTPGTMVHYMIEQYLTYFINEEPINNINLLEGYPEEYTPEQQSLAESAYINWLHWYEQNEVRPIEIEPNLVSEELQVGATPDLIAEVHAKRCLIDWKSGKPLSYTSTLLQLAAYGSIIKETLDIDIQGYYIVVIPRKDETPTFTVQYRESMPVLAIDQFKRLRECYEAEKLLKKML